MDRINPKIEKGKKKEIKTIRRHYYGTTEVELVTSLGARASESGDRSTALKGEARPRGGAARLH